MFAKGGMRIVTSSMCYDIIWLGNSQMLSRSNSFPKVTTSMEYPGLHSKYVILLLIYSTPAIVRAGLINQSITRNLAIAS